MAAAAVSIKACREHLFKLNREFRCRHRQGPAMQLTQIQQAHGDIARADRAHDHVVNPVDQRQPDQDLERHQMLFGRIPAQELEIVRLDRDIKLA
jgi:hypothetical protein